MTTTIRIEDTTKAQLDKIGRKGDTYDDIINILLTIRKTAEMRAK